MAQARRSFEGSCQSEATPDQAWAFWTDPERWLGGPIEVARLDGPFEVGARITTKVTGNRLLTSTVTKIEKPWLWTGVAKGPGLRMTIDHVIDPTDGGVLLTERLTFAGPLAPLAARLMGGRVVSAFQVTTAHAAQRAEADSPA